MATNTVTIPNILLKSCIGLLSLLIMVFGYWANVVSETGNKALDKLAEVNENMVKIKAEVRVTNASLNTVREEINDHRNQPWHDQAGREIRDLIIKQGRKP